MGKGVTCQVASVPKVPIRDEGASLAHLSELSLLEVRLSSKNNDKVDEGDSGSEQDRQAISRKGQRPQGLPTAFGHEAEWVPGSIGTMMSLPFHP